MKLFCITLGMASLTPNVIVVSTLREFLMYMRCYNIILAGHIETLHAGVIGLHRQEISYSTGVSDS